MRHKVKLTLEISVLLILLILFGLSSGLFLYQKTYAGKIYKNVSVDGTSLAGLTKKQAIALLDKKFLNFANEEISITADNQEIKTLVKDTGLTHDSVTAVSRAYEIGRDHSFFRQICSSAKTYFNKQDLDPVVKIDQEKYQYFQKIAIDQLNIPPKDAQITIDGGVLKETAGSPGQVVDVSNLPERIISLAKNKEKIISLQIKTAQPSISSANFSTAKAQAESILGKNVIFSYNDKVFAPNRSEIGFWIKFTNQNSQISTSLNDDNIRAYLNKIAKNIEVQKRDRKINAVDGAVVDEGQVGMYVDKNNAISQIKSQINSNEIKITLATYTEAPKEIKIFPNEGVQVGRFEGKYIDVDLTAQKLCQIESTNILGCFTISSGKASMPTPTGTFHITAKNPKQWSNKYGLWMPWWQQFNGDYGLHELPEWPNGYKEGEAHLGTPVSHGCVRMGIGTAETVYNWTDIGTPVYIHK